MKKISAGILIVFIMAVVFSLLISEKTNALFTDSASNLGNVFQAGSFEPSLQEKLDIIIADVLQNNVLDGAHQNFNHKDSWGVKLWEYISGGSPGSNIYDYQNPISANTPPYYGKMVVRLSKFNLEEEYYNPVLLITNLDSFDYDNVQDLSYFNLVKGSMIIYKPNGNSKPVSYYVINENGQLGPLKTFDLP